MSGGSALFPERPSRVLASPCAFSNTTGFWDRLCSWLGVSESLLGPPLFVASGFGPMAWLGARQQRRPGPAASGRTSCPPALAFGFDPLPALSRKLPSGSPASTRRNRIASLPGSRRSVPSALFLQSTGRSVFPWAWQCFLTVGRPATSTARAGASWNSAASGTSSCSPASASGFCSASEASRPSGQGRTRGASPKTSFIIFW